MVARRLREVLADSRGLTLLEVTVTAALLAALLLAVLHLSLRAWDVPAQARRSTDELTELRGACLWVERDLRRASDIVYVAPGNLHVEVQDASGPRGFWGVGIVTYELRDNGDLIRDEMGWLKVVARGLARADFSAGEWEGGVLVTAEFEGRRGNKMRTSVWVYTGE